MSTNPSNQPEDEEKKFAENIYTAAVLAIRDSGIVRNFFNKYLADNNINELHFTAPDNTHLKTMLQQFYISQDGKSPLDRVLIDTFGLKEKFTLTSAYTGVPDREAEAAHARMLLISDVLSGSNAQELSYITGVIQRASRHHPYSDLDLKIGKAIGRNLDVAKSQDIVLDGATLNRSQVVKAFQTL